MEPRTDMMNFVKAMTDVDRLRIIGLLARGPRKMNEMASELGVHPADLNRHLDQLIESGVVRLIESSYVLDDSAIEKLARAQFGAQQRPAYKPSSDANEDTRRILTTFLNPDGTIRQLPPQPSKLRIILNYLINAFSVGVTYKEKEVNMILARFNPDVSGLRRDLVDAGMLQRERDGSKYWRPE